ncbi:unnamed protein product [Trifolium pratense]|uniref:Uncharacterized protein n=1 Tax=Trifolium pratense TaxID=57577 RepID=A0ACB0ITD9_TRIPR|nr:unnamed protein product [Trifolium pratense]
MRSNYGMPWNSWKQIDINTRDLWFGEFKKKFNFCPPDDSWAGKNFERRGFKKKSIQEKTNRAFYSGGFGKPLHTCGSITTSQHRDNLCFQESVNQIGGVKFIERRQSKDRIPFSLV